MLAVNEEFYSVQGEGLHTGIPMYFLRLQGCDVGCYFCDTKYTWKDKKPDVKESEIIKRALESRARWLCITGGEPYEQDLTDILLKANLKGLRTTIETSGSVWKDYNHYPNWITLSPKDLFAKKGLVARQEFKWMANEIKVVVTKQSDLDYYLENYYSYCGKDRPLIFQPVDNDIGIGEMIINFIKKYDLVYGRCMIQCHKVLNLR